MVGRRPPGWTELGSPRARLVLALLISLSIAGEWLFSSVVRTARAEDGVRGGPRCAMNAWSISRAALRGSEWFQRRFVERRTHAHEPAVQRDPVDVALEDALRASASVRASLVPEVAPRP